MNKSTVELLCLADSRVEGFGEYKNTQSILIREEFQLFEAVTKAHKIAPKKEKELDKFLKTFKFDRTPVGIVVF